MSVYDPHPEHPEPTLNEIRIVARRERVKSLLARRMTIAEISDALDASMRTVERDVVAVRQQLAESLSEKDALAVAGDITARASVRQRELWGLYAKLTKNDPATVSVKVTILRELRAEAATEVEQMQKLGIVYQAPRELLVSVAAVAALRKVPEEALTELAMLPQEEFLKRIASYVGEEKLAELIGSGDEGVERY